MFPSVIGKTTDYIRYIIFCESCLLLQHILASATETEHLYVSTEPTWKDAHIKLSVNFPLNP